MDRPEVQAALAAKVLDRSFEDFVDAAGRVGHCARPVRLTGSSVTVDTTTGEVVDSVSSHTRPLGVVHTACGNRRAHVCPACSRTYARDPFTLIHAGVAGGKSVPELVADNPLIFVTLTAPPSGRSTATAPAERAGPPPGPAHPVRARAPDVVPEHSRAGRPGQGCPVVPGLSRHPSAVLWQWHAPELWRRLTISLRRASLGTTSIYLHHLGTTADRAALERLNARGCAGGARVGLGS